MVSSAAQWLHFLLTFLSEVRMIRRPLIYRVEKKIYMCIYSLLVEISVKKRERESIAKMITSPRKTEVFHPLRELIMSFALVGFRAQGLGFRV